MLKNINKKRLVLELILLIILYILSYPFIHSKNDVNNIDNIDIENNTEVIVITNDTDEVTQPTKPTLTPETTLPKESEVISETLEEIKESEKKELEYKSYSIPKNKGFKSYMGYKTLTNKSSWQYKLQQSYAKTGDYGIRMVEGRYCIAVGSHFKTSIGQYLDLVLENGTVIPCIMADLKADIHTDSSNIVTLHNGCVSEFVVDTSVLNRTAKKMGDISYCLEDWKSPVVEIRVYDKNIFD